MKKIVVSSLVSLFVLSCSVTVPNNSSKYKEDFSSLAVKYNFAELEKEYKSFSTKALSDNYVKRMFGKYLVSSPNSSQLIRQIEFSRYLKNNGDSSYHNSLKNMFSETPSLYGTLTGNTDVNQKMTSDSANFGTFIQGLSPAPDAPIAISPTNIDLTSFIANWNTVPNATGYKLFVDGVQYPNTSTVINSNSYNITGVTSGLNHTYYVIAVNLSGNSAPSNTVSLQTMCIGINTIAGTSSPDNVQATLSWHLNPEDAFFDTNDNLYIVDSDNHKIRKVTPGGIITTVAGTGVSGYSGDGGSATTAMLNSPKGVAVDNSGNIYIADTNNQRIRKVNTSGIITTIAGTGTTGFYGDDGPATSAMLNNTTKLTVDNNGNIYIADNSNWRIRKITAGIITTIAGTGTFGFSGDGGVATSAMIAQIVGIDTDNSGNIYLSGGNRIRKITASTNIITTVGGNGSSGYTGDGGLATSARITSRGVTTDSSGNIYFADYGIRKVRKINAATNIITSIAGIEISGNYDGFSGDGGPATSAKLSSINAVAVSSNGNVYFSDRNNHRIRKLNISDGTISTFSGGYLNDNANANSANVTFPSGIAGDNNGNIYFADSYYNRIRKINTNGIITTFAGTGESGNSGNGGQATSALLLRPMGIAVDNTGNIYFSENYNHVVRKIDTNGIITVFAGSFGSPASGDGGAATSATLLYPEGLAADNNGNIYIADTNNHRIRKVNTSTGIITTVAGNGAASFSGDGGAAVSAMLNYPTGVAVDSSGNIYIADSSNNRIRKVTVATGIITTVAGSSTGSYPGDGGAATSARLSGPKGVALDSNGNIYISDSNNNCIRKVNESTGIINTIAGNGTPGFSGDGGLPTSANLNNPNGVFLDSSGNIYIADKNNQRIRKILKQ